MCIGTIGSSGGVVAGIGDGQRGGGPLVAAELLLKLVGAAGVEPGQRLRLRLLPGPLADERPLLPRGPVPGRAEVAGDVEMLQDLVMAACNEATKKVEEASQKIMGGMLGGLGLPPGMF